MSRSGKPSVRMKDVAAELGLSAATISRALTRPDLVTSETRNAVVEAVERLNYRPNLVARQLRRRSSNLVLMVVPQLSPFYLELFEGVERKATELGITALMANSGRDARRERMFLDQVLSRRADGVLLVTGTHGDFLHSTASAAIPLVAVLEKPEGSDVPTVRVDDRAAARDATRHLIALGHRRVAHVAGMEAMTMAKDRRAGFLDAVDEAGLDRQHCYIVEGDFSIGSGDAAGERLLTRYPRPTAIFAANDEMAVGAAQALKRNGIVLGRDVSLIGYDDQRLSRLYRPSITTVQVPKTEIGYIAMTMLHAGVQRQDLARRDVVLPTRVVERATTGPCRG
jgi:LacI family repressor for deo operon, udp, cdd, tsx, nupC, and nupG